MAYWSAGLIQIIPAMTRSSLVNYFSSRIWTPPSPIIALHLVSAPPQGPVVIYYRNVLCQ